MSKESTPAPAPLLLIADRDVEVRGAAARELREAGFSVEETDSLAELARVLAERQPDAVLLDAGLGQDAIEACQAVRGLFESDRSRLLVSLDVGCDTDLEALSEAGADDFLERPLNTALVCHRLRRLRASTQSAPVAMPQTGELVDRDTFLARLHERMPAARAEGHHIAVIAITLQDEGEVLSHVSEEPDRVFLVEVTERIRGVFEECDEHEGLIGLLGGMRITRLDSRTFAMMIPGVERIQDAAKIGGRVHNVFLEPFTVAGHDFLFSSNIGITAFPDDRVEAEELVECALTAAHRARQEGRDHLAFHTEAMGRWALERLTLEHSLRSAITNRELRVYYQPRVDAHTRRILGMECLVRWQHPQFGLVSPGQFIPLAEETGLIVPISEWVLREGCRQNKAWRDQGLPPIRVSVNLSPVQFQRSDLYDTVTTALHDIGLPEDGLELEVTESMLMNDPKATIETLRKLKGAGIHLSIDDFGTGYSSLSYLKRFPIDALKIDRSFIMEVTSNPDDAAITTAIILMGHSLRLSIVAEGVETESQLEFLKVLKCNEIQGFLISPPVPAEQAEKILRGDSSAAA